MECLVVSLPRLLFRGASVFAAALMLSLPASAETLIVGNKAEDTVSLIDLETGEEISREQTGPSPALSAQSALSVTGRDFR